MPGKLVDQPGDLDSSKLVDGSIDRQRTPWFETIDSNHCPTPVIGGRGAMHLRRDPMVSFVG